LDSVATILLVEDDELQGKATKNYLESKGFEIFWVNNGKYAIKRW
jgi:DNA-binding response OmpR family regulator